MAQGMGYGDDRGARNARGTGDTSACWKPMSDEDWSATIAGAPVTADAWSAPAAPQAPAGGDSQVLLGSEGDAVRGSRFRRGTNGQVVGANDPDTTAPQPAMAGYAQPNAYAQPAGAPRPPADARTQVWATPARRANTGEAAGTGTGAAANPYAGAPVAPRGQVPAPGREQRPPRTRRRARHGCLSFLLWLVMAAVAALMTIRTLPSEASAGRMIPELVSFVPLVFVPIGICLLLALLWRRRVLAVVCVAALAMMGWWHVGYFVPTARVSDTATTTAQVKAVTDDGTARLMTLNTAHGEASAAEIVRICREQHVEVLCLQELTQGMVDDLEAAGIDEVLPYHVVSDQATAISNGGRNGIWTLAPMENVSQNLLPIQTSSMPAGSIYVGGTLVRVVSVHPNSPIRGAQDLWDEGLSTIRSLNDYGHAYLVMGDFNSTWDHARFRELLGTRLADAGQAAGEGFHMTYPANSTVPPVLEIDHILYAKDTGIVVSNLQTVAVKGSDHMALLGTLEVK